MTLSAPEDLSKPLQWPEGGVTRVPYRIYTDPEIYALEQSCIYRGPIWNFLCLELEIANPGDFKPPPSATPRSSSPAMRAAISTR